MPITFVSYCSDCGSQVDLGDSFCSMCGTSIPEQESRQVYTNFGVDKEHGSVPSGKFSSQIRRNTDQSWSPKVQYPTTEHTPSSRNARVLYHSPRGEFNAEAAKRTVILVFFPLFLSSFLSLLFSTAIVRTVNVVDRIALVIGLLIVSGIFFGFLSLIFGVGIGYSFKTTVRHLRISPDLDFLDLKYLRIPGYKLAAYNEDKIMFRLSTSYYILGGFFLGQGAYITIERKKNNGISYIGSADDTSILSLRPPWFKIVYGRFINELVKITDSTLINH